MESIDRHCYSAEYSNLEGAFACRAVIERAKGIMMARQSIDENKAFELMRSQSQKSGQKLFDIAKAVVDSHLLLVPPERTPALAVEGLVLLAGEGLGDVPPVLRDGLQLLVASISETSTIESLLSAAMAEGAGVDEVGGLEPVAGREYACGRAASECRLAGRGRGP